MPKIFIFHGWTYDSSRWQPFLNLLKQNGYDAKMPAIPGLTGKIDRPWTIADYDTWLGKTLAREKSPFILLGHSNGGRLAMRYAAKYPRQITRLILIDSAGIYHRNLLKILLKKLSNKIGKSVIILPKLRQFFHTLIGAGDYRDASPAMKITMTNILENDRNFDPGVLSVPTTIIWGENDTVTPVADGRKLRTLIPGASLNLIGGAGHAPQYTHADQVLKIILKETGYAAV